MTAPAIVTCGGTTRAGDPCRSRDGLSAEGLCALHDPARAAAVARARRKGSTEKASAAVDDLPCGGKLATLEDCAIWLEWITVQTVTGGLDPAKAREAVKAVMALRFKLRDEQALANRIKALQKGLATQTTGGR